MITTLATHKNYWENHWEYSGWGQFLIHTANHREELTKPKVTGLQFDCVHGLWVLDSWSPGESKSSFDSRFELEPIDEAGLLYVLSWSQLMKLVFCTFWAGANWWRRFSARFELEPIDEVGFLHVLSCSQLMKLAFCSIWAAANRSSYFTANRVRTVDSWARECRSLATWIAI